MTYTLTRVKTFIGREGYGLNATICRDGKPVAFVCDDASGGMIEIDFTNPLQTPASFKATPKEQALAEEIACVKWATQWWESDAGAACRARWEKLNAEMGVVVQRSSGRDRLEDWINDQAEKADLAKRQAAQLRRWAKTQTPYRLKGDEPGVYRMVTKPVTHPGVVPWLIERHGLDKIETIYGYDLEAGKAVAA